MEDINNQQHSYLNNEDFDPSVFAGDEAELKDFLDKAAKLKLDGFKKSKPEIWDAISESIDDSAGESGDNVRSMGWKTIMTIAASTIILIVAAIAILGNTGDADMISHVTEYTESKTINLPDGSVADLNAGSELSYLSEWDRTLTLKGEAFFEVTEGDKFTIETENGQVQVLGTSFNVSDRGNVFAVSCKTGKVKVDFFKTDDQSVFLTKGESVMFEKDTIKKLKVDIVKIADWKKGTFHFVDRPVAEAFNEIRRQYDVKVKVSDKQIKSRLFTGYFYTGDLQTSLNLICEPMGLSYSIDGKMVIIESNK
ncbi:MAG: FecR domain-containing protein [Bacteroidota bacterium]